MLSMLREPYYMETNPSTSTIKETIFKEQFLGRIRPRNNYN